MGSSLTSARGYDSDAQCLGTPPPIGDVNRSPRTPASRRMGVQNIAQAWQEQNMAYWNSPNMHAHPVPAASYDMLAPSTPQGSVKGPHGVSGPQHMARVMNIHSTTSFNDQRSGEQNMFAKSLPSLHLSQEQLAAPNDGVNKRQGAFLTSSSENIQDLEVDWAKWMSSNASGLRNTSSESLNRQSPEIAMTKRRQPSSTPHTHSDTRMPFLGDLDLSHRLHESQLASSSQSANPSMTNSPQERRRAQCMVSSENAQSDIHSGSSTVVGPETPARSMHQHRDVSSFYSRQSDEAAGNESYAIQSLKVHAANAIDSLPNIQGRLFGQPGIAEGTPGPPGELVKSKFDHQEANTPPSIPHTLPNSADGTRKVSPGWMTGGRRVGYGYRLVDNTEESTRQSVPHEVRTPTDVNKSDIHQIERQRTVSQPVLQPPTWDDSRRHSPLRTPTDPKTPVRTPSTWTKMKRNSVRVRNHAPPAIDLAGDAKAPRDQPGARAILVQPDHSPTPASVEYVEDDGNFASRWSRGSLSRKRQSQSKKKDDLDFEPESCTPDASPIADRRLSMDQTVRRASVYFDPANDKSADKVNGQPSRSRSGRWILRFFRNRDNRRLSAKPVKEPSPESSGEYEECPLNSIARSNSVRSDIAAELASDYQQCIQMPGAFYGSGWASRTSLIVEAE
ncbi:unnamed protein product [Penicillium olsonii]|nr:unnamed protein product [Penicillium olsonii]